MIFALLFFKIWSSNAPWKTGIKLNDPEYLPVPPLFGLVKVKDNSDAIIADLLTFAPGEMTNDTLNIVRELNERINSTQNLESLNDLCFINNNSQACLVLARIYEFGAYGKQENHTLSYELYKKASDLNNTHALSVLSYYHRYPTNNDPISSIIESDATMYSIDSILASSIQHSSGNLRPKSCSAAARILLPVAQSLCSLYLFPNTSPVNQTELERIQNSTQPMDLYTKAMAMIYVPYPSNKEKSFAKDLLKQAFEQGYQNAAAPLATLYLNQAKPNISKAIHFLSKALVLNDPAAMLLASELFSISDSNLLNPSEAKRLVKGAASQGYAPAIHKLGILTYYGLIGIPRSATKGFELFSQAAAMGYRPSIFQVAQQMIGGDGVVVDCEKAVEMLRRIVDTGPWSDFYDKYVSNHSLHAYTLMNDLGLTPCEYVESSNDTKWNSTESLKIVRAARDGNITAIIWLIFNSNLRDAEGLFIKLRQLDRTMAIIEKPLRAYIIIRGYFSYMQGKLDQNELPFLMSMASPFLSMILKLFTFILLSILIILRVQAWSQIE